MEYQRWKEIHEIMKVGAFDPGFLQDAVTFLGWAERRGISIQDIKDYSAQFQKNMIKTAEKENEVIAKMRAVMPECPLCGEHLITSSVPEQESKWNMRYFCPNTNGSDDPADWCGYEKLSEEDHSAVIAAARIRAGI